MAALTRLQLEARMAVMRGPIEDIVHDFTTMTSAQVLADYPLSSGGSNRYVPQTDGSYVLRESDEAPVSDAGLWLAGAAVQQVIATLNRPTPDPEERMTWRRR